MKKAKAALKKSSLIKQKPKPLAKSLKTSETGALKSAPKRSALVASMQKSVKKLAKGLVKAMSGKPAKKPQVKAAPKAPVKAAAPAKKVAAAVKKPLAAASKTPPAKQAPSKPAPAPKAAAAAVPAKGAAGKGAPVAPVMAAKPLTKAAPVSAVLTKGKGKGKEGKEKGSKLTGALLAAHLEKMCRETGCENLSTTKGYCRLDYIKNWKKIKRKEMILKEGKLNQYIEELVSKYPEKYIDVIRQDLNTEVNFNKVIHDLELDESIDDLDYDGDSIDALIGGIKKESEDFGDEDF